MCSELAIPPSLLERTVADRLLKVFDGMNLAIVEDTGMEESGRDKELVSIHERMTLMTEIPRGLV